MYLPESSNFSAKFRQDTFDLTHEDTATGKDSDTITYNLYHSISYHIIL